MRRPRGAPLHPGATYAFLIAAYLLLVAGWIFVVGAAAACTRESGSPPAAQGRDGGPFLPAVEAPATLRDPWRRVRRHLDAVAANPQSTSRAATLLNVLWDVYVGPDLDLALTPEETTVFCEGLLRAHAFAMEGRSDFLEILMHVGVGSYGKTVEGDAWLNELLWENLERHPGATLAALAENGDIRAALVRSIYTRPVSDRFDFTAIRRFLEEIDLPEEWAHLDADLARIVTAIAPLATAPAPQ